MDRYNTTTSTPYIVDGYQGRGDPAGMDPVIGIFLGLMILAWALSQ